MRTKQLFGTQALKQTDGVKDSPLSQLKFVVLDECDQMSSVAQGALRRIMEQSANQARFCLICNYVSKIIPPL